MFDVPRLTLIRVVQIVELTAVTFVLSFCGDASGPPLPTDAEQFSPPAVYSTWWNMTQACSGLTGSMGAVTWFKTSEVLHEPNSDAIVVGYWSSADNRIVLATDHVLDGGTVRHEILHALIKHGGHQRNQFLGNCEGTVVCEDACVRDAGAYPTPPATPIHIGADSLEVTAQVQPQNPTMATDGGFFTITVIARNRSAHWATVQPVFFVTDTTRTFSYDVQGAGSDINDSKFAIDPSQRIFAPGESKRMVFDFRIGDDAFSQQLQLGNYSVRGSFSDFASNYVTFVVGP